ncbi:MAG: nickel pincer cofactor biosynthesis protein LarC [Planctomycetota bacterium]|jgi:uncharacterized protein (TIGR00299 family) protein|nr:nickel pincer cofactor biosynthesis protein LarC [Planctomycetota bacterium]
MHLHIDCQFGLAGDMLLAALVDAGADGEGILRTLGEIIPDPFGFSCRRVSRKGVTALLAEVTWPDSPSPDREEAPNDEPAGGHRQGIPSGGPHRHLADLLALLEKGSLPARASARAERIFRLLAEAEAAVHGSSPDKVHFHEISGIDTAVDVIGGCLALEHLEIDSVSASLLTAGSGMVMCEHGIFPVPAPATLEILKRFNIPWRSGGDGERATPTGVAILAGLAESFGPSPGLTVLRIGYGAGRREFPDVPNLLRIIVGKAIPVSGEGESHGSPRRGHTIIAESVSEVVPVPPMLPGDKIPEGDRVVELRFAVDDMTPESLAHLGEKCLAAGALDFYILPAVMKKGRPGHEVTLLAPAGQAEPVADVVWKESTTFGMRVSERSRLTLARDFRTVTVLGQPIRIKLGWLAGKLIRRQPEYGDCQAAALAVGESLNLVFVLASRAAEEIDV